MARKHVVAVDLGASSGRVMDIAFDGKNLSFDEVHRFPNTPVQVGNTLHWDVLRLWYEIQEGLQAVATDSASIGVDTWGVDFALLDRNGQLLANPVHYRDQRTDNMMDWFFKRMPRREVFDRTGIQFMQINTLYQLSSLVHSNSPLLESADTLLTISDLFNYWLSGSKTCEFTEVTTSQCYNPTLGDWDRELLTAGGIPTDMLVPIVQPGTRIGEYQGISVIATACHDTGSAVAAVPTTTEDYAYISSGTWSLLGLELPAPVINDAAYEANLTNEGGVNNTFRFLKNIMGLWFIQQCRETWSREGHDYTYDELVHMANEADLFRSMVDPDNTVFLPPGDMPQRIRDYTSRTNQPMPETHPQVIATVYTSLAMKYRYALEQLLRVSGRHVEKIHVIGGGSQNALLCQMTANATGKTVIAGPVEATALGNAIVQLIALGEISDIAEARAILSQASDMVTYQPQDTAIWEENYQRFTELLALEHTS